ncbi:MAG: hypothetical protein U7123_15580 [Potamolinea sp.]
MVSEKQNSSQDKLEEFSEALAEARKMQHDWMTHGLDFVDLYVEDVDGDWLEKWGEDEEELDTIASPLIGDSVVESLTAFLKSDDLVAVKVRERLGEKSPLEFATQLEKCLSIPEEDDRILAVKNALAGGVTAGGNNRDSGDENEEIKLLDLAESLLEKLADFFN